MCLIFVGILGKYPQSVITGDSQVQFLVHPDCVTLRLDVFSTSDMSKWSVDVYLLNDDPLILKKKILMKKLGVGIGI